ncbi:hypothetical protein CCH79_00004998 [Gambusia affinis]|uniref:Gla domain-containing protein n=1 Tax=Gambusia affinis TaxID=33528 RepID=A0A315V7L9_GAMAF|nr:hypothetical protein CCH79_00004998 [Gambusia affinis]
MPDFKSCVVSVGPHNSVSERILQKLEEQTSDQCEERRDLLIFLSEESAEVVQRWQLRVSVLVLNQNTASQFLSRHRRANSLFEESKKGNLERECIEEVCNKEEAREIFENHPETEYFYPRYVLCLGSHRVGINNHNSQTNIPPDLRTCVMGEILTQGLLLP